MNHEPDDLLKDVLANGELDALREKSLQAGLAAQRAQCRRRRGVRTTLLAAVPLLLLAGLMLNFRSVDKKSPAIVFPESFPSRLKFFPTPAVVSTTPIPTISDQELLALFPNRPVGLIGPSGQQRLVLLDQPAGSNL